MPLWTRQSKLNLLKGIVRVLLTIFGHASTGGWSTDFGCWICRLDVSACRMRRSIRCQCQTLLAFGTGIDRWGWVVRASCRSWCNRSSSSLPGIYRWSLRKWACIGHLFVQLRILDALGKSCYWCRFASICSCWPDRISRWCWCTFSWSWQYRRKRK